MSDTQPTADYPERYELSSLRTEDAQQTPSNSNSFAPQSAEISLQDATPSGGRVQELAPTDRGVRAWTFCICACIVEMMIWGFSFSYGIFQEYYTTHPPFNTASSVSISAVGTVSLGLQYAEAFLFYCLFSRYPDYMRFGVWVGLVLAFVSLFLSSFASQVWQLLLCQGILFGISGGLLYAPVIKLLPEWFVEKRGLAGGIIFAGGGVGGFVFPFILNALLERVGLKWTLRIWAVITVVVSSIAALGVRPRLPVPRYSAELTRPRYIPPQLGFAKNPVFWGVSTILLLQGLSYFPVSLYIASYTSSIASPLAATIVLSLFNSSSVAGQIVLGHMSDHYPYPWVMFFSACGSGMAAFLLWGLATAATQVYFFAVIFGALSGGFASTWPNAAFDCTNGKPEHTGMALASTSVFKGISAVLGPILSGILFEAGKGSSFGGTFGRQGYGALEIFVGSCALATGVCSIFIASMQQRAQLSR